MTRITSEKNRQNLYDVIVVGFGIAGACAAIEALSNKSAVMVIDAFDGGGSSRRSGGVIYAGGGTRQQKAAGFTDTMEQMHKYLKQELGNGIKESTLKAFCKESLNNHLWLEKLGLDFRGGFYPKKTTQPPAGSSLYFSGNEIHYASKARPYPRGHVPASNGMAGEEIYGLLRATAEKMGAEVFLNTRATGLITGEKGAVIGINMMTLEHRPFARAFHTFIFRAGVILPLFRRLIRKFEKKFSAEATAYAKKGVVICAGGFSFNRDMIKAHAPKYAKCMPLGTPGDDGSGISMGMSVGADTMHLDSCSASRFYSPPTALSRGILVDSNGIRLCDESMYGSTISRYIAESPGSRAWLIIDSEIIKAAREETRLDEKLSSFTIKDIVSGNVNYLIFRKLTAFLNLRYNRVKRNAITDLASVCRINTAKLIDTIEKYNRKIEDREPDEFNKPDEYRQYIMIPPFYAVDCGLGNNFFLDPCMTLGGLRVDGTSGRVVDKNDKAIPGLFAAGRSAAGICSASYVSGLSLADCVFSGRNAGRSAARSVELKILS
jgi:3-oxo-5alpha-steroid 4-dehydrogenase